MSEELQAATPEEVVTTSETAQADATGEADTPEVQETDEQINERVQKEAEERAEKRARGVQKRIDELTADKHAERKRADELAQLNAQLMGMLQKPQVQAQGEPKREDFDNDVDYLVNLTKYQAEKIANDRLEAFNKKQTEEQTKYREKMEQENIQREFVQRRKEAEKSIPDFKEVVSDWEPNLPYEVETMIARMPEGPLIAYHLAKNPELEAQFSSAPSYMHGVLLGQMLSAIKAPAKSSSAPPPGKTVQSKAGTSTEPPSDPEQYRAWADKHMR